RTVRLVAPRQHLERRRVRLGQHVRLIDPRKPFYSGTVEPDPFRKSGLQFGGSHRNRLEVTEHVGEPQSHEADIALLKSPEHEFLLSVHGPPSSFRTRGTSEAFLPDSHCQCALPELPAR